MGKLFVIVFITLTLGGCKNSFEEKDKGMDQLDIIENRWEDAYRLASSSPRIALATPVSQLQSIRRDLNQVTLSACLSPAKSELVSYMDSRINQFIAFIADADVSDFKSDTNLVKYFKFKESCTDSEINKNTALALEAKLIEQEIKLQKEKRDKLEAEAKAKGVSVDRLEAEAAVKEAEAAADAAAEAAALALSDYSEIVEDELQLNEAEIRANKVNATVTAEIDTAVAQAEAVAALVDVIAAEAEAELPIKK